MVSQESGLTKAIFTQRFLGENLAFKTFEKHSFHSKFRFILNFNYARAILKVISVIARLNKPLEYKTLFGNKKGYTWFNIQKLKVRYRLLYLRLTKVELAYKRR